MVVSISMMFSHGRDTPPSHGGGGGGYGQPRSLAHIYLYIYIYTYVIGVPFPGSRARNLGYPAELPAKKPTFVLSVTFTCHSWSFRRRARGLSAPIFEPSWGAGEVRGPFKNVDSVSTSFKNEAPWVILFGEVFRCCRGRARQLLLGAS